MNAVTDAILNRAPNQMVAEAMLLGSDLESSWNANAVGDNSTSFGPFQMHIGGALTSAGGSPAQAEDPNWSVNAMLSSYEAGVNSVPMSLWSSNPEQAAEMAAVYAERPAQSYFAGQGAGRVNAAWQDVERVLGGSNLGSSVSGSSVGGSNTNPATLTSSNPLDPTAWIKGLASLLGIGSVSDMLERGSLIVFGAVLMFVGFTTAFKQSPVTVIGKVAQKVG